MVNQIEWAKRVDPKLISRLYASDARQIQDLELADEVGYGLYARAESLIKVNRAHHEFIIDCPSCGKEITGEQNEFVCCCGFRMTKKEYHITYKRKQLVAISIVPFTKQFMTDWERAKDSYPEKMKAIDYLIHCFHYELEQDRQPARPAIINFVDCTLIPAIELIFTLAYGGGKGYNEQMERWLANAKASHLRDCIIEKQKEFNPITKEEYV